MSSLENAWPRHSVADFLVGLMSAVLRQPLLILIGRDQRSIRQASEIGAIVRCVLPIVVLVTQGGGDFEGAFEA